MSCRVVVALTESFGDFWPLLAREAGVTLRLREPLNARQEVAFDPPLAVADGSTTSLTIRFDLTRWFVNAAATALVNPTTANPGGVNEHVVRDNIRGSIRAFRDDDHDGEDDDHEDGGDEDGAH